MGNHNAIPALDCNSFITVISSLDTNEIMKNKTRVSCLYAQDEHTFIFVSFWLLFMPKICKTYVPAHILHYIYIQCITPGVKSNRTVEGKHAPRIVDKPTISKYGLLTFSFNDKKGMIS